MDGFEFAVVGAGWRTDFFLRIAAALPQMHLCGVVVRKEFRAIEAESRWGVPCFCIYCRFDAKHPAFICHRERFGRSDARRVY